MKVLSLVLAAIAAASSTTLAAPLEARVVRAAAQPSLCTAFSSLCTQTANNENLGRATQSCTHSGSSYSFSCTAGGRVLTDTVLNNLHFPTTVYMTTTQTQTSTVNTAVAKTVNAQPTQLMLTTTTPYYTATVTISKHTSYDSTSTLSLSPNLRRDVQASPAAAMRRDQSAFCDSFGSGCAAACSARGSSQRSATCNLMTQPGAKTYTYSLACKCSDGTTQTTGALSGLVGPVVTQTVSVQATKTPIITKTATVTFTVTPTVTNVQYSSTPAVSTVTTTVTGGAALPTGLLMVGYISGAYMQPFGYLQGNQEGRISIAIEQYDGTVFAATQDPTSGTIAMQNVANPNLWLGAAAPSSSQPGVSFLSMNSGSAPNLPGTLASGLGSLAAAFESYIVGARVPSNAATSGFSEDTLIAELTTAYMVAPAVGQILPVLAQRTWYAGDDTLFMADPTGTLPSGSHFPVSLFFVQVPPPSSS